MYILLGTIKYHLVFTKIITRLFSKCDHEYEIISENGHGIEVQCKKCLKIKTISNESIK